MIAHSRPTLGPEDAEAVAEVVRSGHLSQGPRVASFEKTVAERLGRRGGVAVSSGTAALALALAALGVGPGDEVVVPAFACSALGHAVRYVGASVVLADVDDDCALAPGAIGRFGRRTRAVVAVHPFGHPVDLGWVLTSGVPVVEDCAQALGASRDGRPAGRDGTVAVCSFYATKIVAAGEGGMLLADDPAMLATGSALRAGGSVPLAFNHKLSDLAAGLALAQVARLEDFIRRRRQIAARFDAAFAGAGVRTLLTQAGTEPSYSRYVVRVPDAGLLIAGMARRGVEAKPAVGDPLVCGADPDAFPGAMRAVAECVSLPLYPTLTEAEIVGVIAAVREVAVEQRWI